jgi:hypothetical protein
MFMEQKYTVEGDLSLMIQLFQKQTDWKYKSFAQSSDTPIPVLSAEMLIAALSSIWQL